MVIPIFASLTSLTASATPASSGGPRKARLPVCGSRVPIFRVRSWVGPAVPPSFVALQPLRTRAPTPTMAMPLSTDFRLLEREAEAFANTLMLLLAFRMC